MKANNRIICKTILLIAMGISTITNAQNFAPSKLPDTAAQPGFNNPALQGPVNPPPNFQQAPPNAGGAPQMAPMVPPVSMEQTKSQPSAYKISESVREMLDLEIKAALITERNKYGIKSPDVVAQEQKAAEVKAKKPTDSFDVRALYGIMPEIVAEVRINGANLTYRTGKALPDQASGMKTKVGLWRLVKIEGDCVYLSHPGVKRPREVCYSSK
jgi:hypothetical protein